MKQLLPLLMCITGMLCFTKAIGQSNFKTGYVILNNNDTINGLIDLKQEATSAEKCVFKQEESSASTTYQPVDIKAYRITNSKYYVSKDIWQGDEKRRVFLEFLLNGVADLFFLKDQGRDRFFIEKEGELIELTNEEKAVVSEGGTTYASHTNRHQKLLIYLFQDAPELKNDILNTNFGHGSLIGITKRYHKATCDYEDCIEYAKSTTLRYYIELLVGYQDSKLVLKGADRSPRTSGPVIGFNMRIESYRGTGVLSYMIGLKHSSYDFNTRFRQTSGIDRRERIMSFEYELFAIPVRMRYTPSFKKVKPFVDVGLSYAILANTESSVIGFQSNNGEPFRLMAFFLNTVPESYLFISSGLGVNVPLSKRSYLIIRGEYGYGTSASNTGGFFNQGYKTTFSGEIGYGFNIN